jgi:integrase
VYNKEIDALYDREVERLVEIAETELSRSKEVTIKLLLATGMRASEAAHLTPEWLSAGTEHTAPKVTVPAREPCECTDCMKRAKRNMDRWVDNGPTEEEVANDPELDESDLRPEEGTPEYADRLEARREAMWKPKSEAGADRDIHISNPNWWGLIRGFVEEHGGLNAGRSGIYYRVNAADDYMDLEKPVSPHILRHTAGSSWARHGMDLHDLKDVMGHASLENTQVYLHSSEEQRSDQAREVTEQRGW